MAETAFPPDEWAHGDHCPHQAGWRSEDEEATAFL
jgi:hypothetical protein